MNGIAVQNFYADNDSGGDPVLAREDRHYDTGASMASSPVIILRKGKATSYVGTGAGVTQDPLPSPPSNLLLLEWEQIW